MKFILCILCCSCGVGSVDIIGDSEDAAPKEKTCEYVVDGLCVNGGSEDIVREVIDIVNDLMVLKYGKYDYVSMYEDKHLSVDFISEQENEVICGSGTGGCIKYTDCGSCMGTVEQCESMGYYCYEDNSIYISEKDNVDGWVACGAPAGKLGHELLHFYYRYLFEDYDYVKDSSHQVDGLFCGEDNIQTDMYYGVNAWCKREYR